MRKVGVLLVILILFSLVVPASIAAPPVLPTPVVPEPPTADQFNHVVINFQALHINRWGVFRHLRTADLWLINWTRGIIQHAVFDGRPLGMNMIVGESYQWTILPSTYYGNLGQCGSLGNVETFTVTEAVVKPAIFYFTCDDLGNQ